MTAGAAPTLGVPWAMPDWLHAVEVNGYPLAYRDEGEGPTIVLLHGSFNDCRSWSLQVPVLATRYRVLAPCLRHYYPERWDGRGGDFSVEQHAEDVAEFVLRAGLGIKCTSSAIRAAAPSL